MKLARGLPGRKESPVLKELNDIRQFIEDDLTEQGRVSQWDMTTQTEEDFKKIAAAVLPEGKFTDEDIKLAFDELRMLDVIGGSQNPTFNLNPVNVKGINAGKSLLQFIPVDDITRMRDDNRSREMTARAFVDGSSMLPVRDTPKQLAEIQRAFESIVATTRGKAPSTEGMGLAQLSNSGIRANLQADTPEFITGFTQNAADLARGFDRYSRDSIVNQVTEFGHYIPIAKGGLDASSNGRMQAMSANKAAREFDGTLGLTRLYGPSYINNQKQLRMAGDVFAMAA